MDYFDLLLEKAKKNRKYFENYLKYARMIKKIAKGELKDVRVYVFGSVVKGSNLPSSDIDIVVVSRDMPERMSERSKIKVKIWKKIGIFSPFEVHLVNEKEFKWYKSFVDKKIAV